MKCNCQQEYGIDTLATGQMDVRMDVKVEQVVPEVEMRESQTEDQISVSSGGGSVLQSGGGGTYFHSQTLSTFTRNSLDETQFHSRNDERGENEVTPDLESDCPLRGQDLPYPAVRGNVTPPLSENEEVNEPETFNRSLTPNTNVEVESEPVDPMMEWLQEGVYQHVASRQETSAAARPSLH